jgi:murein DD-endopeptidase MepM/ murein hydrolase activator NlpD
MQTNKTGPGKVLAAAFTHAGKTYIALRYRDRYGRNQYYDENGKSLRKAFRRKPVNIGYISSPFNLHRRHPILGTIRPHTGTDLAAPYGTPIHATGDGRIIYRARRGGYGRCIVINHGNGITTLYAHMSRFNRKLKLGSYVKMSQVIGYVGSSGMSTGPHVHYEYRINHHYKNPMTVKLPNAAPIPQSEHAVFKLYATKEINALQLP